MIVRKHLLTAIAGALLWAGAPVAPASAHLLTGSVCSNASWCHITHSRDVNFFNGTSQTEWSNAARWGQLEWHHTMNGSLRFSSSSHSAAAIHAVDAAYGQTGWLGYAYNANLAHNGHGHLQLNTSYFPSYSQKQSVACHEIGHFVGLAHSSDATDCMVNTSNYARFIAADHRDQLRIQWNATGH